jgi:cellulose synthase/poly-beta-1,6-N-acetylglucosamine synthase-like glycosyltransferase
MFRETLIYIVSYIGLFVVSFYVLSLWAIRKKEHPILSENKLPMVSIIVPAFNEAKGIAGTIKSALEIDYPKNKLEVIVVDDGSKDDTYKIASEFRSNRVRVFRLPKNSGKGAAMNYAISKSKREIIVTMDADNTHVKPDALRNMVACFNDSKVMCVSPMMTVYNPRGILQRVQQIEYFFGIFLRKAFASVNAIHVTPGAFSAYKKSFFDKYGGFDEHNLTEDLEMALRIQLNNYVIENSTRASILTVVPNKFKSLALQRRRWNAGLLKNLWNYRVLFSRKYGVLGILILPIAILSVIFSLVLSSFLITRPLHDLNQELIFLSSVNYNIFSNLQFNLYGIQRYFFILFSDPITVFTLLFIAILGGYIIFGKSKVKESSGLGLSMLFFLAVYSFLFVFWWIVSIFYTVTNKKVSWR